MNCLAPRGASGLKYANTRGIKSQKCLAPRGASGLKFVDVFIKIGIFCLAPRGASGLKFFPPLASPTFYTSGSARS